MQWLKELAAPKLWTDPELWQKIRKSLPNYRLSKFQDALPEFAQAEMMGDFLLDIERASYTAQNIGQRVRVSTT